MRHGSHQLGSSEAEQRFEVRKVVKVNSCVTVHDTEAYKCRGHKKGNQVRLIQSSSNLLSFTLKYVGGLCSLLN